MRRIVFVLTIGIGSLIGLACRPPAGDPLELRALLARAAAHAGIDEWEQALAVLGEARSLAPDEAAIGYDEAVVLFLSGDPEGARQSLDRLGDLPNRVLARVRQLEARLAYESGDLAAERSALQAAVQLEPADPALHFARAEVELRDPAAPAQARGEPLRAAFDLWPENTRLASEYVLWALENGDEAARTFALELLERLVREADLQQLRDLFEQGREQAKTEARPIALRQTLNLLRSGERFRSDAAELEAELQLRLLNEPIAEEQLVSLVAPEIRLEPADFLPPLPSGFRSILRLDDAVDPPSGARRETDLLVLTTTGIELLARNAEAFSPLLEAEPEAEVALGDLDGDGRRELLLFESTGLRLWGRDIGEDPWRERSSDPAFAGLRGPVLLDWERDGDLDLLAIDAEGRLILTLHRGEAGLGSPEPAPIEPEGAVSTLLTTDLDADGDRDLVLVHDASLAVWRNWGQGEYGHLASWEPPSRPIRLYAVEANGDGFGDVVVQEADSLALWTGDHRARLTRSSSPIVSEGRGAIAVADFDLDGAVDLVLTGSDGPVFLRSSGSGEFAPLQGGLAAGGSQGAGALTLDLDGDHDPDLLTWSDGALQGFRNSGAEGQGWLTLALRAPQRKVPRDGWGTRVEVVTGRGRRWLEPDRPEILIGLGDQEAALIRTTWPNGISEYLFTPAARTRHVLELTLRVEGSCPFLYASDGVGTRFVTDLLGLAPLGMLAAPGSYVPADPEEYVRLPDWVQARDGEIELWITEELREAAYFDQVELVAVDAPKELAVHNGEQWRSSPVEGLALRPLAELQPPESVLADDGREVLDVVRAQDHRYLTNHRGEPRYQGAVAPHRLTVQLPAEIAASDRPALLFVGWLHWGNTSTNVARSQDPEGAPIFPYLEVPDGSGSWLRVAREGALPAGKTKPVVVDLTGVLDPLDPRVRITTDFEVYWDWIAVGRIDEMELPVHRLPPGRADLSFGGFSRWYRPAENGPYLFDPSEIRPLPWREESSGREVTLAWTELQGYHTEFGDVTGLVERLDERLVVFGAGERLTLGFSVEELPPLPSGWRRSWFLHSEGWERDGDPNVSCRATVEPLPRRGVKGDPCDGLTPSEPESDREAVARTRWVDGDRLLARVEAEIAP